MNLPISISPCPVVAASAEVKFESGFPEDAIFGLVYGKVQAQFPSVFDLPLASIPAEIRRADPDLTVQPLYRLESNDLIILVGPKAISVGSKGGYPGWKTLAEKYVNTFGQIAETGVFKKVRRLGLRYINFFHGDILSDLTLSLSIRHDSLRADNIHLRANMAGEHCSMLLQVITAAKLTTDPKKTGTVIDIDCSTADPAPRGEFRASLAAFLEDAHTDSKALFFDLLKPEFLHSLNPKYDA
jgi:uncharacterized protein (TIGR04255 family)